jgi:hypothetical protein
MILRRTCSAAIVVALTTIGGVAAEPAGRATPVAPGGGQLAKAFETPTFRGAVYGDFAQIGNSVLRCPQAGDQPAPSAQEVQSCQQASQRQQVDGSAPDEKSFYLQPNHDPASGLFNQGQAQLTLPPGATVRYAQLNWGGNTGRSDLNIVQPGQVDVPLPLPSCTGSSVLGLVPNLLGVVRPARKPASPPAAAGPQQQDVKLSVGSTQTGPGTPVSVTPTHFAVSGQTTEMYSAYADVTSTIAAAVNQAALISTSALSPAFTVTVGDVWAVAGHGCAAGWSLVVVFGYPQQPADPNNPYRHLREVDVYSDHFVQEPGATTSVAVNGLNNDANAAGVEVGVTAYGGDSNHSGQFTAGGQTQNDPCSAAMNESAGFFSSCALGALDPITPGAPILNNFSVDAKAIAPTISSTSNPPGPVVDLGMSGSSDPYLLQTIVLSQYINPRLAVTVTGPAKVHRGNSVPVTVTVQNTGDVPLYKPTISSVGPTPVFPSQCQGMGNTGVLAPGHSQTFACSGTAPATDFSATATATAQYRPNDPSSRISAASSTTVRIIRPIVSVALSANSPAVRAGQPVTLTFTVANNSDPAEGPLNATLATNPGLPGCAPAPMHIPTGYEVITTCTFTPAKDVVVTATANATDSRNAQASARSTPLRIAVMNPSLDIAVTPDPAEVSPGEVVNFTVTVRNTGDVPLAVTVSNDGFARFCDFSNTQLPPGAAQSQKCTVPAPSTPGPFTDNVQYTANPVGKTSSGVPITGLAADSSIHGQTAGTANVRSGG